MAEKKKKIIILIAAAAVVIAGVIIAFFMTGDNRLSAVMMRLLRLEGTVSLQDEDGKLMSIIEKMKLHSGNVMNTGQDGLVEISLDDTKIVTVVEESCVEFNKNKKELELNLTKTVL